MARSYSFGPFRLDEDSEILFRGTEPTAVGQRAVALLRVLVERPGAPVSKDALIEAAWPGLVVEESNLPVQIAALRKVLGQEVGGEGWIETLPRRGYRFVGPIPTNGETNGRVASPPLAVQDEAGPATAISVQQRPQASPGRRQLSILSCELVSGQLELEDMHEAVRAYQSCATEVIGSFQGVVGRAVGNSVVAYFGHPVAHENDVEQAVHAGLGLCAAVEAIEIAAKVPLRCRLGLATGAAIVDDTPDGVVGEVSGLALRLQMSTGDGLIIDETTHRLVGSLFESREAAAIDARSGARLPAWRILRASSSKTRFESLRGAALTPFVGRGRELDLLAHWRSEAATRLCVVDIAGEPGIGKSRLLHEYRSSLIADGVLVLSGNCWPDSQQTSFRPFIEVVRRVFRLEADENAADAARKLETGLMSVGLATAENVGLLMNLVGLPPPPRSLEGLDGVLIGLRTRSLLLDLLRERRKSSPIVVLLEDLHWIDHASEELLGRLIADVDAPALLIVNTYRPSYQPSWLAHANTTVHRLAPLSNDDTARIATMRLGSAAADAALVRVIVDKAEGNPLFAEEIANYLIERQAGDIAAAPRGAMAPLPASVQSLLMARVDRLSAADKEVLQAAAVIGRRFRADILAKVTDTSGIGDRLSAMEALDLIHADPAAGEFVFKHALVCDALYSGLLSAQRAALHLKIAREIEQRNADHLIEVAETLAYHFSRTDQTEKSIEYLALSGGKSFGMYSLDEAEHFLKSAITLARAKDKTRMDVRVATAMMDLAKVLYLQSRSLETIALIEPELARLDALGDIEAVVVLLDLYAIALFTQCRFQEGLRIEERAFEIAKRLGDERAQVYARAGILMLRLMTDREPAVGFDRLAELAYEKATLHGDPYIIGRTLMVIVFNHINFGLLLEGREWADRLMAFGRERQDPRALGMALWLLGWLAIMAQDYEAALAYGEESLRNAFTPLDRQFGETVIGNSQLLLGRVTEGVELLLGHRQRAQACGWRFSALSTTIPLAMSTLLRGEFAKGVYLMESVIERAETEYNYRFYANFARTYLAEFYVALLRGTRKPTLRTLLKNFVFLIRTRSRAAGRAEKLLRQAMADPCFVERGLNRARIEFNLGEICLATGRTELARAHFATARTIAVAQGASNWLTKIDAATALLAQSG
jgi:DNA-binding winged helix-turn-helix (wHTH) protein/tetratricopeptide (TPR) repeat protein